MGQIPWAEKIKYAQHHGLDPANMAAFVGILSVIDNAYLGWISDERKRGS